ncbi:type 1 glutamine amidotransferase domain-containing protein [Mammaliicoccus stepanovicii]|uniref:Intracellular protease amidase n=1 Tax=Mammaliicoccus stepanovicii TaxID=643214 RepID=A0A239ZBB7_9STAP|nr:type 1 glutamine amidotransferase domain-containing protein [Mammaliicoccus stepanovicii]PNZ74123.1 glutamine amidotransferase [Mammaliicoccus stepanovicii]GGI42102.1 glutamine amidotransferase [Mammaliicoccus stepanovicii]SNV68442.1 intracellular protease amidase [Mammaliicoccus stepanovicii]
MSKKVLIVVTNASQFKDGNPTGLWLEEAAIPYKVFIKNGVDVDIASVSGGSVPIDPNSTQNDEAKEYHDVLEKLQHTKGIKDIVFENYDGIFLPGGHGTVFDFPNNEDLENMLAYYKNNNKVVGAVCHGPSAFIGAKLPDGNYLVDGVKLTAFTDSEEKAMQLDGSVPFLLQTELEKQGARFVKGVDFESHVVADGKFVTGQNPNSSEEVAQKIVNVL